MLLRLLLFIVILIILTIMKEFIQNHSKKIFVFFLAICLICVLYSLIERTANRSIVIGHPDNIIVISPEESQDVIVIGDPAKVNVKPKNK